MFDIFLHCLEWMTTVAIYWDITIFRGFKCTCFMKYADTCQFCLCQWNRFLQVLLFQDLCILEDEVECGISLLKWDGIRTFDALR